MFKQISELFENIFSKKQCGFRNGHITQQCLLVMLEKWKRSVDSGKAFGALLTDVSKAFDCFVHELLIAKLNPNGFSLPALKRVCMFMIMCHIENREQGLRIHIVNGLLYCLRYRKDQFWDHFYSTFFSRFVSYT